jgi:hypothetical protein
VFGGTRPTHIEVYIGRKRVVDKECPDPPCHESVFIPANARGSELWIIARDTNGNVEQQKIQITDSDASAGGTMAAAG